MSEACNCIICAQEFNKHDVKSVIANKINKTYFKVCESCIDNCNPSNDYESVINILKSYSFSAEAIKAFNKVSKILKNS